MLEHVNDYLDRLKHEGLKLRSVIDTHTHADHISGAAALVDRTGVQYVMHKNAPAKCARHRVDEGDELRLGSIALGFMYTPGHTTDSLTIRLPDRLLTGDFLFIGEGGAGRTDLPGGNPGVHYDSIQKLKSLPDDLLIFPAHDYHQKTHSTLGLERKSNPRLQPRSRQDYIAWLLDMKLPDVDGMEILKMVRDKKPAPFMIVMTGYSTMSNAVEAMKLGAADYLAKPFTDDDLIEAVEKVCTDH